MKKTLWLGLLAAALTGAPVLAEDAKTGESKPTEANPTEAKAESRDAAKDPGKEQGKKQDKDKEAMVAVVRKLYEPYFTDHHAMEEAYQGKHPLFSNDFNAALAHLDKVGELAEKDPNSLKSAYDCLGYDFIIQGQDFDAPQIKKTLKVTATEGKEREKGEVKATFRNFDAPQTVYFKMECSEKGCLVDDVFETETEPPGYFKEGLRKCIKEEFPGVES